MRNIQHLHKILIIQSPDSLVIALRVPEVIVECVVNKEESRG